MVRDYLLDQAREAENEAMKRLVPLYQVKSKDNVIGGYQRLQDLLPHILKSLEIKPDERIRIKVEGDGRKVGKFKKQTMMSFCVLNQGKVVLQPDNHHVLAITVGGEGYEDLINSLAQLFGDLGALNADGIWVNPTTKEARFFSQDSLPDSTWQHHDVDLLFSSDWKFMAAVLGLEAANSDHPCIWCLCSHGEICDMAREWVTSRTISDQLLYLQQKIKVRSLSFFFCESQSQGQLFTIVWISCEDPAAHDPVHAGVPRPSPSPRPCG